MDRMMYVAMTGARQSMRAQAALTHNLANASTTGFRASLHAFSSLPVDGPGYASRVNAMAGTTGWNTTAGATAETGRALDVAIQGPGFIAVQAPDGGEGYTRAGDLRVGPGGILTTGTGHAVRGDNGPLAVPPFEEIVIGEDGTVSIVPLGQDANTLAALDRIRLVNPPPERLARDADGLMRFAGEEPPEADAGVRLASGVLEASNVNVAQTLISMIELARRFEMQVKVMDTAERNASAAARLVRLA